MRFTRSLVTAVVAIALLWLPPYVEKLRAAAAQVNSCIDQETTGATTFSCSLTANAGNTYAAFIAFDNSVTISSFTDGADNFTLVNNFVEQTGIRAAMGYLLADGSSGSTTYTVTFSGSAVGWLVVHQMSGVDAFDTSAMNAQASVSAGTDSVTSGNISAAEAGYLFAGTTVSDFVSGPNISAGTNFTITQLPFAVMAGGTGYDITASGGTQAALFTQDASGIGYITGVMAFSETGGGGGGPENCNMLLLKVGC